MGNLPQQSQKAKNKIDSKRTMENTLLWTRHNKEIWDNANESTILQDKTAFLYVSRKQKKKS